MALHSLARIVEEKEIYFLLHCRADVKYYCQISTSVSIKKKKESTILLF